ncbi:MAG: serine/threonine-protein kinase [Microthrixaceae bacterium]
MDDPGAGRPANLPPHLRLERPLGRGGSATVWVARDRRRGRWVAVKVLDPTSGPGDRSIERLRRAEREARALARLGAHPGVATVRALGVDETAAVWVVTDLVDGPTLADRVALGRPLDARECTRTLRSLAGALAAAHDVGVVHGDVSPANVVLGADGPVLVDFGVGGVDTSPGDRARTPLVAAPERLRGGRATASADVWSASATVEWATDPAAPVTESTRRVLADCRHPLAARRPTAVEVVERLGPPGSDPEG